MSGADFTARALALRAAAATGGLFSELASRTFPGGIDRIDSTGFSEKGIGHATYVHDELCTAELLAAHPLAVFADASGRIFRLQGDAHGMIMPEQLGCGLYAEGVDQRPAIQAAISYAETVSLSGVSLTQAEYELWAPPRTGSFADQTDHSGCFLLISGRIALVGQSALRATLRCKGPNGGDLASDYQVINSPEYGGDVIWRGHGIKITGTVNTGSARESDTALAQVTLRNLVLHSDARAVRDSRWPAYPPSREEGRENVWDISNKGINYQANVQTGTVRAENVDIIGFLGEAIYTSHLKQGAFIGRNIVIKHTNGQALNPNGPGVFDIDGLRAENCGFSIEGWCGQELGRIVNAHFRGSTKGNLAAGSSWALSRRDDGTYPTLTVDATFEDCGDLYIGSGVHGRLVLIDTQPVFVPLSTSQMVENVALDVTVIADNRSDLTGCRFAPASGGPGQSVRNVDVRLRCLRTADARIAGRNVRDLMVQSGEIGPDVRVRASGQANRIGTATNVTGKPVALNEEGFMLTTGGGPVVMRPDQVSRPDFWAGWMRLGTPAAGTTGTLRIELPYPSGYSDGAQVLIENRDDMSPEAILEVGDIALVGYKDRIKLQVDTRFNRWLVVERPADVKRSATIAVPSMALGEETGPFTIPFVGAMPHHQLQVEAPGGLGGLVIVDPVVETDQVVFYLRNKRGGDPRPAGDMTFNARLRAAEG